MIEVEGYKAYSGKMRVTPKANFHGPFILTGQFLYKPDTDCWYHNGDSYPSDICTPLVKYFDGVEASFGCCANQS